MPKTLLLILTVLGTLNLNMKSVFLYQIYFFIFSILCIRYFRCGQCNLNICINILYNQFNNDAEERLSLSSDRKIVTLNAFLVSLGQQGLKLGIGRDKRVNLVKMHAIYRHLHFNRQTFTAGYTATTTSLVLTMQNATDREIILSNEKNITLLHIAQLNMQFVQTHDKNIQCVLLPLAEKRSVSYMYRKSECS